MAYTAPGTAVAGDVLTAVFWNAQVRDNMTAIAGAPFARNILYNGAMQVAQRNTSVASITTDGYYTADRWQVSFSSLGTWTQSVENDAPTGSGLRKSLKMLCSTADASPAASDYCLFRQALEGQDLQRIAKGTSSAQPLAISFWVKSNKTGTYNCYLQDIDNNRSISAQYTISASGTWEYETVYFPADTTGAFDNDNAASLYLTFVLGAGSNWTSGTTPTSWETLTLANLAPAQTNLAANTNNYWQVTGVQLETGSVATGFEFLPFGDELSRCQRYFERISHSTSDVAVASGNAYLATTFLGLMTYLPKRPSVPVISFVTSAAAYDLVGNGTVYGVTAGSLGGANAGYSSAQIGGTIASAAPVGVSLFLRMKGSVYIDVAAEL